MTDRIIWYRTYYNPIEAQIIRAKLEDSGYHCFLTDENTIMLRPFLNQAFGGVKLMVFERDVAQIDLLLAEEASSENEDGHTTEEEDIPGSARKCEKCGSGNVGFGQATQQRYNWWVTLISLMLEFYPFSANKCYHCYHCGHEFH